MPPPRTRDATEDHPGPQRVQTARGREALLVAFPEPRALPVPIPSDPLGRDWLAARGAPDGRVSSQHAAFVRAGGNLFIEDLGSRNGTFVDGVRIPPKERVSLEDGARIRLGRTLLVYRESLTGPDAASPPIGDLVGPFGLREIAADLEALRHRPPTNVLIEGETGTGKELLARAVATILGRARTYTAVNVAGVPAGVFESQLFGYVPGAYSGSGKGSPGLLLAHDKGAVFLDEIGELPLELQPKLLRFLENREILPVGATRPTTADVLVIAATLRPLEELAREGRFRADLLARFGGRLELPPLRDRPEDLFAVMQALAARRGEHYDPAQVEVEAMERLVLREFQRNVRELAIVLDRVAALATPPQLPHWAVERVLGPLPAASQGPLTSETVQRALESCGGNESAAARKLGITRAKLRRILGKA
jgi:transcriptional regulator of acetoin/glycerol metabolism